MTTHRLHGPWLKMVRANEHRQALHRALDAFYATKPCRVTKKLDSQTGRKIIRIETHGYPPPELGVIAGEFIYQCRSALDHLACALVAQNGAEVTYETGFPIHIRPNAGRLKTAVAGMDATAAKWIGGLQPHNTGEPEQFPLGALHLLSRIDKHHAIPVSGNEVRMAVPQVEGLDVQYLDNGTEVSFPNEAAPDFEPQPSFGVIFGREGAESGYGPEIFGAIHDFIRYEVFPLFTRFFPEAEWFREPRPPAAS